MQSVRVNNRPRGLVEFKPNRPTQAKPEIVDCTRDKKTGEVLTLICTNGKHWDPVVYARLYNAPVLKLRGKGYKGKNPDTRRV